MILATGGTELARDFSLLAEINAASKSPSQSQELLAKRHSNVMREYLGFSDRLKIFTDSFDKVNPNNPLSNGLFMCVDQ